MGKPLLSHLVSRSLGARSQALDGLRGLMILGMILVNHRPAEIPAFAPLVHAPWHGWSLADVIFPGFLLTVGVAIRLSMVDASGEKIAPTSTVWFKVLRRFALLLFLNFVLINFPYYEFARLQFTGTLARIGWCYLIVTMIHLHSGWRGQLVILCIALAGQWALYAWTPVPGFGAGNLTPQANSGLYLDHLILAPLFGTTGPDPDGYTTLLPTLGAVATTLVGLLAGHWLCTQRVTGGDKVKGLVAVGLALIILGSAWDAVLPVNKPLWTSSYVALMGGIGLVLFAGLYWIEAIKGRGSWLTPLTIAGVNALFFYVFAQGIQRLLVYGRWPAADGSPVRLRKLIFEKYFSNWAVPEVSSLGYALVFLAICYGVVYVLYRKRLFIKL